MHARYYSYNLGRFTSIDPLGGKVGLSQGWNRYAYVKGNPVNAVDPDGEIELVPAAGSQLGQSALDYYAAVLTDPNSNLFQKIGASVGGFFAALWTPETSNKTGVVLVSGGAASLSLSLGGEAGLATTEITSAVGATSAMTESLTRGEGLGEVLLSGANGLLLGAGLGRIPATPLASALAGAGGDTMAQLSAGGDFDLGSTLFSGLAGFGGGVTVAASETTGPAASALAAAVTSLGHYELVLDEALSQGLPPLEDQRQELTQ
jgi:hypothetical protein